MRGIAGFTHGSRGLDEAVVRRMTASLTHLGPVQQKHFFNSEIALGGQPLRVDDHVIVWNGEIYNQKELRGELEGLGHRFVSNCHAELVLRAFLEWDTACFRRLRGAFALGIWNLRRKRLLVARDRMGMKPLYLANVGRDVVFGSELAALLVHPKVSRTLDLNALQDYLSLGYAPGPRTLAAGIEKLRPGHFLEWRDGVAKQARWWNPCLTPDITMDEREAEGELDRLLRESVREHLGSEGPVGIWPNSPTLLRYTSEVSSAKLKTFDVEWNAETDLIPALENLEPGSEASSLPAWFLAKVSRRHVTTVLSGAGSDELFGGGPIYRADRLARLRRFLPAGRLHPDEAHLLRNGSFSLEQKQRLMPAARPQRLFHLYAGLPDAETAGALNRRMLVDQQNYLPESVLLGLDRAGEAHSLAIRMPFLDHRIVELARKMPERVKAVMRKRLVGGSTPEVPVHEWLRGAMLPFLNDTLQPATVRRTGLFDAGFVSQMIRDHRERKANMGKQLWTLMTLFLWLKRTNIAVPPVEEFVEAGTFAAAS